MWWPGYLDSLLWCGLVPLLLEIVLAEEKQTLRTLFSPEEEVKSSLQKNIQRVELYK